MISLLELLVKLHALKTSIPCTYLKKISKRKTIKYKLHLQPKIYINKIGFAEMKLKLLVFP